jgi:hypothetical protein
MFYKVDSYHEEKCAKYVRGKNRYMSFTVTIIPRGLSNIEYPAWSNILWA